MLVLRLGLTSRLTMVVDVSCGVRWTGREGEEEERAGQTWRAKEAKEAFLASSRH